MEGKKTPLFERHLAAGGKMVDFAGWQMPIQYSGGIVHEHLHTRKYAGLFDVSHMGRFLFRGERAGEFLQYALTNDLMRLSVGQSQYTILPDENGGAIDDAYLYWFREEEYLLVVNASNKDKDWAHLSREAAKYPGVEMEDVTDAVAMLALQGPDAERALEGVIEHGALPEAHRNYLSTVRIAGQEVQLGRTGYTGEPVCFELFLASDGAGRVWDALLEEEPVEPIGLGARDTLRLEAGLPLYGHELGDDPAGRPIPIMACPASKIAVSLDPGKGEFIGRAALEKQIHALERIQKDKAKPGDMGTLPHRVRPFVLLEKGIARPGDRVGHGDATSGVVTSGTMVPYWKYQLEPDGPELGDEVGLRAVGLALVDSRLKMGEPVQVHVRQRPIPAVLVPRNLENRTGEITYAIVPGEAS